MIQHTSLCSKIFFMVPSFSSAHCATAFSMYAYDVKKTTIPSGTTAARRLTRSP